MSRLFVSSLLALVAATLGMASAAAKAPASLSKVAAAQVPEMLHPRDAPTTIPASEQLDGIRIDRSSFMNGQHQFLNVVGLEGRCVTIGAAPPGAAPSGLGTAGIRSSTGALPMRIERFVPRGENEAALEIVDAWLDLGTVGVREASKTRVPLTSLAKGPGGYEIFGFRKDNTLHVVLPSQERLAYVDERGSLGITCCGHVRLTLETDRNASAMIVAAGRVQIPQRSSPIVARPIMARPIDNLPVPQVNSDMGLSTPFDLRGIQLSVSASRTKRDQDPLLSVTIGWAEEEPGVIAQQNVVEPAIAEPLELDRE